MICDAFSVFLKFQMGSVCKTGGLKDTFTEFWPLFYTKWMSLSLKNTHKHTQIHETHNINCLGVSGGSGDRTREPHLSSLRRSCLFFNGFVFVSLGFLFFFPPSFCLCRSCNFQFLDTEYADSFFCLWYIFPPAF